MRGSRRRCQWGPGPEVIKSEYDQKIPQSHTVDKPVALRGRATEHSQQQDI